jgi:hypothetical protein
MQLLFKLKGSMIKIFILLNKSLNENARKTV